MKNSLRKPRKKLTAQAMVEFALALPVLLLVVYGLLETGRLLFIYASVVTAARNAARYGSATGDVGNGTRYYNDCNGILAAARSVQFIQLFSNITISYDGGPQSGSWSQSGCPITTAGHPGNGDRIKVSVSAVFSPIVPLVPLQAFTITSTSNRTLLVGAAIAVTNPAQGFTGGAEGLALGKKATPETYTQLGQQILYDYTIQNTGTTPVTGPFHIHDDKLGDFICQGVPNVLDAGSPLYTCSNPQVYAIQMQDLISPEVVNHATAQNGDGTVVSNEVVVTIALIPAPHLSLTKTGLAPQLIAPGEHVTYSFTVTNDGNVPVGKPYAIDDKTIGNNWTCDPAAPDPLLPNGTFTCSGFYPLKGTDINAGSVNNTATVSAKFGSTVVTSPPASATVQTPPLQLVITASPSTISGLPATVTYTFSLTNRTTGNMKNLSVTDTRGASGLACGAALASGATTSCQHTYTVTQADLDSATGSFANTATASAQGNVNSNQAGVNVTVTQTKLITLSKIANPLNPLPAQSFTLPKSINYTYVITNGGNVTLTAPFTVVDDKFPGSPACTVATGTLAPGATLQCTKPYPLTQPDLDNGSVTNTAYATAMFGGKAIPQSASVKATVITYSGPRLALVVTPSPAYFTGAGQTIVYTYGVRNTGGQDLVLNPGFTIADSLIPPGTVPCSGVTTLPIGGSATCGTRSYTTSASDMSNKLVSNTVTASGTTTPAATIMGAAVNVPLFNCTAQTLTHGGQVPLPPSSLINWPINNNTGATVHISGITFSWNSGGAFALTQVALGANTIWGPSSDVSDNKTFTAPNPTAWGVDVGSTTLRFSLTGVASGIRISVTFVEPACSGIILDSNFQ